MERTKAALVDSSLVVTAGKDNKSKKEGKKETSHYCKCKKE
jgi:hypothetical protein